MIFPGVQKKLKGRGKEGRRGGQEIKTAAGKAQKGS